MGVAGRWEVGGGGKAGAMGRHFSVAAGACLAWWVPAGTARPAAQLCERVRRGVTGDRLHHAALLARRLRLLLLSAGRHRGWRAAADLKDCKGLSRSCGKDGGVQERRDQLARPVRARGGRRAPRVYVLSTARATPRAAAVARCAGRTPPAKYRPRMRRRAAAGTDSNRQQPTATVNRQQPTGTGLCAWSQVKSCASTSPHSRCLPSQRPSAATAVTRWPHGSRGSARSHCRSLPTLSPHDPQCRPAPIYLPSTIHALH